MENPAILLRHLNPDCARAMEGAASPCQTRAHAEILPDHWLLKPLEQEEGDLTVLATTGLLPDTGARNVDSLLNQQILPVLSQQLLTHRMAKQKPQSLTLGWSEEEGIMLEFDRIQGVNV